MSIAGFENRQALRHPNRAVRIGQVDHSAPPLVDQANTTRRKDETNRAGVEQQETVSYLHEVGAFGVRTKPSWRQNLRAPLRLLCQSLDRLSLLIEPC